MTQKKLSVLRRARASHPLNACTGLDGRSNCSCAGKEGGAVVVRRNGSRNDSKQVAFSPGESHFLCILLLVLNKIDIVATKVKIMKVEENGISV